MPSEDGGTANYLSNSRPKDPAKIKIRGTCVPRIAFLSRIRLDRLSCQNRRQIALAPFQQEETADSKTK
jgi:hypothetical protein